MSFQTLLIFKSSQTLVEMQQDNTDRSVRFIKIAPLPDKRKVYSHAMKVIPVSSFFSVVEGHFTPSL